jgi:hypothetical protein
MKVCAALSKISPAFNDIAIAGELSIQLIEILAALSTLTKNETSHTPGSMSSRSSSPVRDDLLETIAELRCLSSMATTPIEYKLCFGISGCCFTLQFGEGKIGPEFHEELQELEDALLGPGKPRPKQEPGSVVQTHTECFIWALIACAGALEMSESLSDPTTLLDRALDKFPLETADWETLEKILRKFLWNEVLGRHWKRCWQRAMYRRLGNR